MNLLHNTAAILGLNALYDFKVLLTFSYKAFYKKNYTMY